MIKTATSFLFTLTASGIALLTEASGCNSIPDATVITDTTLVDYEINAVSRVESFHIFSVAEPRTSQFFSGTSACSVWVDNRLDSAAGDSLYGFIGYDKDTIVTIHDSTYGIPRLYPGDIFDWTKVAFHFDNPGYLPGHLFQTGMDSARFNTIKECLDTIKGPGIKPPADYMDQIVSILNTAVANMDLYYNNRELLINGRDWNQVVPKIGRLVDEGIFLDSLGKTKPVLSTYERTAVRWFNIDILSSHASDAPQSSNNDAPNVFPYFYTSQRVHKFLFEQWTQAGGRATGNFAVRLFSYDRTGEQQMHFAEANGSAGLNTASTFSERMLLPFPYTANTNWSVTPMFWHKLPMIPFGQESSLLGPGRAIVKYAKQASSTSTAAFDMELLYPVNGTLTIDKLMSRYIGTIVVRFRYSRYYGTPTSAGPILEWSTDITIRRTGPDGKTTIWKETNLLERVASGTPSRKRGL